MTIARWSLGIAIGAGLDTAFLAFKPRKRWHANVSVVPTVSPQEVGGSLVGRL
jgi:hypothetical protein